MSDDNDPMPVFPLKGRDALALEVIVFYRHECLRHGLIGQAVEVLEAFEEMAAWQRRHPEALKFPDHRHVPTKAKRPPTGQEDGA